jgi:uncharacterized membrane protein
MLASFLASLVEFVEALTVILAIGTVRGWRSALVGAGIGIALLALLVAGMGPALTRIPLKLVQLIVGSLLLLFGIRWLRKAILRAAGVIALHDEAAIFARETRDLAQLGSRPVQRLDAAAAAAAFKIVMLEGMEVVFIVLAVGAAGQMLVPASIGALVGLIVVALFGLALHKPLARVPENTLKFAVGVLLTAFGTFWAGEGLGVAWPGDDTAILILIGLFLLIALVLVPLARSRSTMEA